MARARDDMSGERQIRIDENSRRKGHEYVTAVHDLQQKRLLFVTAGRDHQTVHALPRTWPSTVAAPRPSAM